MSIAIIITVIAAYFGLLMLIAHFTKSDSNQGFFLGNRQSPWYVVAFGMIGASLSGVTFLSVPGTVASDGFTYMQMVLGYLLGYLVIIVVLLPLYYKMNLTSIYEYLQSRYGKEAHLTGSSFFLVSRIIGASFRLYLVAAVFEFAIFKPLGIESSFIWSVVLTLALIYFYTKQGGIKTIVWTDTLQTFFMILAVVVAVVLMASSLDWSLSELPTKIASSGMADVFQWDDRNAGNYFWKYFFGGAFITIAMTGLDQDMMQKNLTCRNLRDAQKNMFWFSTTLVVINLLFLSLGVLLYQYAEAQGMVIPTKKDMLFPMVALNGNLGLGVGVFFLIGLIAAAFSSADSALTSLTTSVSVDFLNIEQKPQGEQRKIRTVVHISLALLLAVVIIVFKALNDDSVIKELFTVAGYTYGPLLGLFFFGLLSKKNVNGRWIVFSCLVAPTMMYILNANSVTWFNGYKFGFELLPINGLLTGVLLWVGSFRK